MELLLQRPNRRSWGTKSERWRILWRRSPDSRIEERSARAAKSQARQALELEAHQPRRVDCSINDSLWSRRPDHWEWSSSSGAAACHERFGSESRVSESGRGRTACVQQTNTLLMAQHPLPGTIVRHAVLIGTAISMLAPFIWMVSLSLKTPNEIFQSHWRLWPDTFYGFENYRHALTAVPLLRYMVNGVIVCASVVAAQIIVACPAAYALSKLKFRGRDGLFALVLIALLIPHQVLALPLFILFYKLHLLDTYAALIIPGIVSPFAIFLLRQFFRGVPNDLVFAARLDGMSELGIVWRVMVPLARPAIIAFAILSIVSHWNDLFWPLIVLRTENLATPPLGIMHYRSEEAGGDYGALMAGAVMITAPLILAFLIAQRRFIEGIAMGSVK